MPLASKPRARAKRRKARQTPPEQPRSRSTSADFPQFRGAAREPASMRVGNHSQIFGAAASPASDSRSSASAAVRAAGGAADHLSHISIEALRWKRSVSVELTFRSGRSARLLAHSAALHRCAALSRDELTAGLGAAWRIPALPRHCLRFARLLWLAGVSHAQGRLTGCARLRCVPSYRRNRDAERNGS